MTGQVETGWPAKNEPGRTDAEICSVFKNVVPSDTPSRDGILTIESLDLMPGGIFADVDYEHRTTGPCATLDKHGNVCVVMDEPPGLFYDADHPLAHLRRRDGHDFDHEKTHRAIIHNLLAAAYIAGYRKRSEVIKAMSKSFDQSAERARQLLKSPESMSRAHVAAVMRLLNVNLCDLRAERRVSRLERIQATLEALHDPWLGNAERIINDLWLTQYYADQVTAD